MNEPTVWECMSCEREIAQAQMPLCIDCLRARRGLTHPRWYDGDYWHGLRMAANAISNASEARYELKQQQRNRFTREELSA